MQEDPQFENLIKDLEPFPNFFQMDLRDVDRSALENVLIKRDPVMKNITSDYTLIEKQRDINLKAFILYKLGKKSDAEILLEDVIKDSTYVNVNANAMMAIICYRNGKYWKCRKIMEKLMTIQGNQDSYPIDIAWAEMGYGYAMIGVKFYDRAIDLYRKVIARQEDKHPEECYIWKFGLALALRRCLVVHLRSLHSSPKSEEVHDILRDIMSNCGNDAYVARAYMEYADVTSYIYDNPDKEDIEKYINESLRRAPDDHRLLANAGKLFRRIKKFDQAEIVLRKSIEIYETGNALLLLGFILKGKLIAKYLKSSRKQVKKTSASSARPARQTYHESMRTRTIKFPKKPMMGVCGEENQDLWKECLDVFEKSFQNSAEAIQLAAYEMGLIYLLWDPPVYDKALEQFRKSFCNSTPLGRCEAYYMAALCLDNMSQDEKLPDDSREEHRQDAAEMRKKANYYFDISEKEDKFDTVQKSNIT